MEGETIISQRSGEFQPLNQVKMLNRINFNFMEEETQHKKMRRTLMCRGQGRDPQLNIQANKTLSLT
jgi:hypothetical protein